MKPGRSVLSRRSALASATLIPATLVVAMLVFAPTVVAQRPSPSPDPNAVASDVPANALRPLTHAELLAIRGERDRYTTWGVATLVAEAVVERNLPTRGPSEGGQGGPGFGTLPRDGRHPGDPVVVASNEVASMLPTSGPIEGLIAFSDGRSSGVRVQGPVMTPNGTYLTPIEPSAMAIADALPAGSQILVRGWFTLLEDESPCPEVPPALDPNDSAGWGSPFVRCPGGWLTAAEVTELDDRDPTRPAGFGIPVPWAAIEQFDADERATSAPPATYLLRHAPNPIEGAEPSLGWKVVGRVGPMAIPTTAPADTRAVLAPGGLDWRAGMERQPPADQWQVESTAWAGGFATIHGGADRVLSSWVSADGTDWQGAELPVGIRSVAALLRLGEGLVIIANADKTDGVWSWETWHSTDGLAWTRTSRERVPMPTHFEGRRRVVQGFWSLGNRIVTLATYTETPCCGRSSGWMVLAAQEPEPDAIFTWVTDDGRRWTRHRTTGRSRASGAIRPT